MRKLFTIAAFMVALGATAAQAQTWRGDDHRRYEDNRVYRDNRGEYSWRVVERRVWIPEYRKKTIFGTKVIPGHYEIRRDRVKVYNRDRYRRHPHGMPPGQRKKWEDRHDRNDRDYGKDRDNRKWND
ncbi:MAG TPA: hypothetical protein VGE26_08330 [Sphingobacteriaceae bacterium]